MVNGSKKINSLKVLMETFKKPHSTIHKFQYQKLGLEKKRGILFPFLHMSDADIWLLYILFYSKIKLLSGYDS